MSSIDSILSLEGKNFISNVAEKLKANIHEKLLECLLTCLCFYHGLSSKMIKEIKVKDFDIDRMAIHVESRAPIFYWQKKCL